MPFRTRTYTTYEKLIESNKMYLKAIANRGIGVNFDYFFALWEYVYTSIVMPEMVQRRGFHDIFGLTEILF